MIIKGAALEQLFKRPSPVFRALLFYGPNEGRVREYAMRAAQTIAADLSDPFRVTSLNAQDLKDDPARLGDEAAQIAMTGERRVIRLRGAGDGLTEIFANFLKDPRGDTLIVAEAAELGKTSKLRKLFETSPLCGIAACYEESAADLDALVTGHLRQHGLSINSDAKAYLLQCLSEDRLAARQELDKLVLYKWPGARARETVGVKDAGAIIDAIDSSAILDTSDVRDVTDSKDGGGVKDTAVIPDGQGIRDNKDINDVSDTADGYDGGGVKDAYDVKDTNATHVLNHRQITLADVTACIGDSSVTGLDDICDAMAAGDLPTLDHELSRAFEAAMAPVAILRAGSNHLLRLQLALALARGGSVEAALGSLRPPVHFSRTGSFRQQLRMWNLARLSRALDMLLHGEAACKTTGAPDHSLCCHVMMQVAQLARQGLAVTSQ